MKILFISLVAFLFAFFVGCQENSITDPVTDQSIPNVDKDVNSYYSEVIKLDGLLFDPSHPISHPYANIDGTVRYRVDKFKIDRIVAKKVGLLVNTSIHGGCATSKLWRVTAISEAIVRFDGRSQTSRFFEKTFKVCNTCCAPLQLDMKFELSNNVLKIVSTKLTKYNAVVQ
jgi:hypothetical protein